MGRPRRYEDDAARKRAQRERERGEEKPPVGVSRSPGVLEMSVESLMDDPIGEAGDTPGPGPDYIFEAEETYVARELAQTRAYVARIEPGSPKASAEAKAERLRRAEKYARWRYRGWLAGEVFAL